MNRFEIMEAFFECLNNNISNQERLLSFNEIYSLLNKFDVKEEDLSYEGDPRDVDKTSVYKKWREEYKNDDVIFGCKMDYWFQFRNKKLPYENPLDYIKMYVPLDAEHIEKGVEKIIEFMAENSIYYVAKAGPHIRFDDFVVRLTNEENANKLAEFIKNDSYIQEGLIKPNPFAIQKDGIAYACDGGMSYNSVVASLMRLYMLDSFEKTGDFTDKDGAKLSLIEFREFVRDFYNNCALYDEYRNLLVGDIYSCDNKTNINDCMHIMELIYHNLDPKFTYNDFIDHYKLNVNENNRPYVLLPEIVLSDIVEETVVLDSNGEKNIFERYDDLCIEIASLEGSRASLLSLGYDVDSLDNLIAQKKGELAGIKDGFMFYVDDVNEQGLQNKCKLVRQNVYLNKISLMSQETNDLIDKMQDEEVVERLRLCSRYASLEDWENKILDDICKKNLKNLQELLAIIKSENPEEYRNMERAYRDLKIKEQVVPYDGKKMPNEIEYDDEKKYLYINFGIENFRYGEEFIVCLATDLCMNMKIEDYNPEKTIEGELYSGNISLEENGFQQVQIGSSEKVNVFSLMNGAFDFNVDDLYFDKKYYLIDSESGKVIIFSFGDGFGAFGQGGSLARDINRAKKVSDLERRVMPWHDQELKAGLKDMGLCRFAVDVEEKEAREKLKHCDLFNCIDDKDSLIDSIIRSEDNQLKSAVDIVNMIKNDNIKMYQDMEDAYNTSKNKKTESVGIHL